MDRDDDGWRVADGGGKSGFGAYTRTRTHEGDSESRATIRHPPPAGGQQQAAETAHLLQPSRAPAREGYGKCGHDWPATRILGVDIGAHGAAALLDEAGDLLAVEDLPTLESGPACRPEISPALFAGIVRRWTPTRAWIEHIGPRIGDRPAGAFAFGGSRATVEAVLACCGVPFRTITPATWKRAASIPAGREMKGIARSRAVERWPRHAELFGRVKDHDRAEAALIGWAGLQRERVGR